MIAKGNGVSMHAMQFAAEQGHEPKRFRLIDGKEVKPQ